MARNGKAMTMVRKKFWVRSVWSVAFLAAVLTFVPLDLAWSAKGDLVDLDTPEKAKPITITLGKAEMVDVGNNVSDVMVANPGVIDVTAVQSNRLYIVGLNIGDTNIIALDENGDIVKRIDIHVSYDIQAIQALVDGLFPDEQVKVGAVHDQILLTGTVSNPSVAARVTNIVGHYVSDLQDQDDPVDELVSNLMEVRGGQQVMLQVRIIEATRSVLKELGVQTNANDPDDLATATIFGNDPPGNLSGISAGQVITGGGIALSKEAAGIARIIADTGLTGVGAIGLFLNALEEQNLVNILAEPNLTAVSGETAGFLAGGEFPVPVGRDQIGNIVIEFREFGVSLNFKPIVLSDKRISLNLNTEVSSLDFENALTLSDLQVPGLDVRKAETTVEIASGGSLMIAGLLQSDAVKGMSGLPGISKAPVLGKLVSSDSFERNETELVVIVTPYLVEPYAETERATPVPVQKNNPLAESFADNMRRIYKAHDPELFLQDEQFGYLLD
jgi:pilus assembly protein CpaC